MLEYVVRRFASFVIVLLILALFAFSLVHMIPGDAALVMLGEEATPTTIEALRQDLGLDQPLYVQFYRWVQGILLRGDFGTSVYVPRSVAQDIAQRLPVSFSLAAFTVMISAFVGVPAGIVAAIKHGSWVDRLTIAATTIAVSMPEFWLGLMFVVLFAVQLRWFPSGGYVPLSESIGGFLRSLFLPSLALGLKWAALVARMSRSSMLDVMHEDYVNTARAKGLPEKVVLLKHVLRNAIVPIITVLGLIFGVALGGAIVIETIFTLPGVGRLLINSIARRDFPIIQGAILIYGLLFCLVNFGIDILYVYLDPRIKYG